MTKTAHTQYTDLVALFNTDVAQR